MHNSVDQRRSLFLYRLYDPSMTGSAILDLSQSVFSFQFSCLYSLSMALVAYRACDRIRLSTCQSEAAIAVLSLRQSLLSILVRSSSDPICLQRCTARFSQRSLTINSSSIPILIMVLTKFNRLFQFLYQLSPRFVTSQVFITTFVVYFSSIVDMTAVTFLSQVPSSLR